ncbi:MAG: tyrosine-type recombinase/integrase [Nostocales cyanobacterium LE14-WE4]|jgi:hypothetical protein|nr:tyrosine-type recombinase/integrase [Anabaena sp. 49633_E8]MCE2701543.1 tyrosine-type recombinase/integrase [Anabaena sp. 49633_E8]MDJ0500418.1 tyrosine-type recombinase/integrase [Nostocales cyanobacterium LE14-WE4]
MVSNFKGSKAAKGSIGLMSESGRLKVNFPRQHFPKQVRKGLQLEDNPENRAKAESIIKRLEVELEDGKLHNEDGSFNEIRYLEILADKGVITLKSIQGGKAPKSSNDVPPPKSQLGLLEIWDRYCEYIKPRLRESSFAKVIQGNYSSFLKSAIEATKSQDAIKIKNWLIENRNITQVKTVLFHLSKAHRLAIKHKFTDYDPYDSMSEEIAINGAKGKKQDEIDTSPDEDVLDQSKAYTWEEYKIILDYVKSHKTKAKWYDILAFKFLTGCRTGEAIGMMWCDVSFDRERILIRRTYNNLTKSFYPLKNHKNGSLIRMFPMPKNGELWELLKSIPQGKDNDIVFKVDGKIVKDGTLRANWRGTTGTSTSKIIGIIPTLIEQGKLRKYLPCYNTRHTFITHQVFDLGRDEKIVSAWCGHNEKVSEKHYQDISDRANQINPELPANQSQADDQKTELEMLKEQLKQQQEMINKLLSDKM